MNDKDFQVLEAQVASSDLQFKTALSAVTDFSDALDKMRKGASGLMTGFKLFDRITGGIKPTNFMVLAAPSNGGKTTYTMNLINNVLQAGKGVLLFSLEMDAEEVAQTLVCINSQVFRSKFNTGKLNRMDQDPYFKALNTVAQYQLYIFDEPDLSMEKIRNACLLMTSQHNISLIVIDYLQLVNTSSYKDNREQQVAAISRGCKRLAKECRIPIIGLSQLNEKGEVRESRAVLHDANIVGILSGTPPKMELAITKGRSIPKGSYFYNFNPDVATFEEVDCDKKLHEVIKALMPE